MSRTGGYFQYQKLQHRDEEVARPRWRWIQAVNGKVTAVRFYPVKKLKWSQIASALLPRRLVEFPSKIHRARQMDVDVSPTIIFSSQWGLPVLSHSSLACKKIRSPHARAF